MPHTDILFFFVLGCITACLQENHEQTCVTSPDFDSNIIEINIRYTQWACYCPRWSSVDSPTDSVMDASKAFEIIPQNDSIALDDTYLVSGNTFRVKGRFSSQKKCVSSEEGGEVMLFQYDEIEVLKPYAIWIHVGTDSLDRVEIQ